jgi:hypothetical protein
VITLSNEVLKGTGASRLTQAIRRAGYNEYDRFELATVTAALPSIAIKVDNMPLVLDAGDVIIAEHLTEHTRTVSINGGVDTPMVVRSPLHVGDRIIVASSNGGQTYVILDKAAAI